MTLDDSVSYVLDVKDCIEWVGDTWDRAALAHGAATLCGGAVVGTSLWSHLHGSTTFELYRLILARVRHGHLVVVPFDGSSPGVHREMHLQLRPLPDGRVECTSRISREDQHPPASDDALAPSSSQSEHLLVCSWCSRIRVHRNWCEIDEGVATHRLFFRRSPVAISHGLCHRCAPGLVDDV